MGSAIYDLVEAAYDYPTWHGHPRRTIVICTHPRSGSTLLGEALHFAGGLGSPLEYFHVGFRPALARRWAADNIADYAAAVTAHRTDPGGTLSVKLFWRDVMDLANEIDPARYGGLYDSLPGETSVETYRAIAALLAPLFPNPTFIHLARSDRIRQAISAVAATDTGRWRHIPQIDDRAPSRTPSFELDRIDALIAYSDFCHAHWQNFFDAIGATPHVMTYEGLAANYDATVTEALRFLGSAATPPPIRMRRQADEISEAIVLQYLQKRAIATGNALV